MSKSELQQQLFGLIKTKISGHVSAADEIAQVLDISADSAYRRMRGEKSITLDELYMLCSHYRISLDQMMNIQTNAFLFQGKIINSTNFRFEEYLTNTLQNMAYVNSFKQKEFYTLCKDIHLFHHFHLKEFAAFKFFFWVRTIFHFPEAESKKFSFKDYDDNWFELGKKILNLYNQLDSVEVWNLETINASIRQIEFYRAGQLFEKDSDILIIYEALEKLLSHLEKQAELGYKFNYDDPQKKPLGSFQMYFNEVLLLDNSTLGILDGNKITYIVHTVLNFMITRDNSFCENLYEHIQNQMRKSTLISSESEKERARFFKVLRERIATRKQALEV
ncbi:MAG: hypothetical protein M3O67_06960 [Bacteroidota bacterium]|nr:hypothetical protein [Bacteroidota bacterium]